jgi:hypothetical protein
MPLRKIGMIETQEVNKRQWKEKTEPYPSGF